MMETPNLDLAIRIFSVAHPLTAAAAVDELLNLHEAAERSEEVAAENARLMALDGDGPQGTACLCGWPEKAAVWPRPD
jgi:hypothetical protein